MPGQRYARYPSAATRADSSPKPVPLAGAAAGAATAGGVLSVGSGGDYVLDLSSAQNPLSDGGKWVNGGVGAGETDAIKAKNWQDARIAARTGAPGTGNILCASGFVSDNNGAAPNDYNDCIAHVAPGYRGFAANQFVEGTLYIASGYVDSFAHEAELLTRFSITTKTDGTNGDAHGYEVLWSMLGELVPVRWNGARGDFTDLGPGGTNCITSGSIDASAEHVNGTKLRIEHVGNILTAKLDTGSGFAVKWVADLSIAGTVYSSGQPGVGFWPRSGSGQVLASKGWSAWKAGDL